MVDQARADAYNSWWQFRKRFVVAVGGSYRADQLLTPGLQPRDSVLYAEPRHTRDPWLSASARLPRLHLEGSRDAR
jgi:hypothetical protein